MSTRSLLEPGRSLCLLIVALVAGSLSSCGQESTPMANAQSRLILYTSLPEDRARAIVKAYPDASGIVVNHMLGPDDVLIRKMADKEHHPGADVLLISGAGALTRAVDSDVLRPIRSAGLDEALGDAYRDPDGYWFGVGVRAEMIAYDRRVVDAADIEGYAELGDERWQGRLCLQRGSSERSRSLVAAMIAARGERDAELAVRGWRVNLATSVFDEQSDLLATIENGGCAIGIVSSDEYARFVAASDASSLGFVFPGAGSGGTQLDLTAAGVSRHANDPDAATKFIEWLLSEDGQRILHGSAFDYPVADAVPVPPPMDEWPDYAPSPIGASRAGYLHPEAVKLIERARYR